MSEQLSPQGQQLVNYIGTLTNAQLDQLDDALASYGEVLGLTDGCTDGVTVLELMISS